MATPSTLLQALDLIDQLDEDAVIFARKPWDLSSPAVVTQLAPDLTVPTSIQEEGLSYFLEASVAREVLSVLEPHPSSLEERRALLLFYAEYDAYPDWVYSR